MFFMSVNWLDCVCASVTGLTFLSLTVCVADFCILKT